MTHPAPSADPHSGMRFRPFVAYVAALMMTNSIAIDSMLPALPEIAHALGVQSPNEAQFVVTAYLLGFGGAQIVYGTLADRFGRKPVLLFGLAIYVVASVVAVFAGSFAVMMAARVVQGIGAAASRVLAISIVRDCFEGRQMARVMSLVFIVFLAAPILAPSIGQIIMLVAPWRAIFGLLTVFGVVLIVWTVLRLHETLHPEDRVPISVKGISHAAAIVLRSRVTVGYMFALTMVMGGLFGFVNSAQQIFADTFGTPQLFTILFAMIAVFMAMSSLLNARIVGRLGMRRVSHAALIGYIAVALLHLAIVMSGMETIVTYAINQAALMFCFGLLAPNFNAMAMEPVGHVAGTASSLLGTVSTAGGAVLGLLVGQSFDGTTLPLALGFACFGVIALVLVLVAERGRLFHAHHLS